MQAEWLRCTTPGMLATRSIILLTLIVTPSVSSYVAVDPRVRSVAAALLLAHAAGTLVSVRRAGRLSMVACALLLACDGVLCGALVQGLPQMRGPGLPLVAVLLAIGFQTAGWGGACGCVVALIAGVAGAGWLGIAAPLILSPRLVFSTMLSVETLFAGAPAVATAMPALPTALLVEPSFAGALTATVPVYWPPTALGVETSFAGMPVVGSVAALFLPTLLVAVSALALGGGVSLLRVGRAPYGASAQRR